MRRRARPSWFEGREESLGRRALLAPLAVAAWLYGAGAWLHRRLYDLRLLRRRRLACRVVSVGNLLVGGTGKTPAAAWLAAALRRRGTKVVLASRGYRRVGEEPVRVVSDGRFVHASAEQAGDEPLLLAAHASGVPVLVGRDRARVALRAIAAFGAEVVLLDDGFQHHRLARDLELVSFDGGAGLGNGRLLPRGPLREPLSALGRAHAILVVDGPLPEADAARIRNAAPAARWFAARRRPTGLRPIAGGTAQPPDALAGKAVGMLAGIARPASLRRTLEALGARIVAERVFPDHHRYRPTDLAGLGEAAPLWVTTEKDAVKILPQWVVGADLGVLVIELDVDEADVLLDWLEERLRRARR